MHTMFEKQTVELSCEISAMQYNIEWIFNNSKIEKEIANSIK